MVDTRLLKIPYPDEFSDSWFQLFQAFADMLDFTIFASLSDHRTMVYGGGTFEFKTRTVGGREVFTLTWNNPIIIRVFSELAFYQANAASVDLEDKDGIFIQIMRDRPQTDVPVPSSVVVLHSLRDTSIRWENYIFLCMRVGDRVIFRNGRVLLVGRSEDIFMSPVSTGVGGGLNIVDDNLSSQIDGTRTTFSTSLAFEFPKIALYLNGQRLVYGADFVAISDFQVQTISPFVVGDRLIANYVVKGSPAGSIIWEENLSSQVNGTNKVFTTAFDIQAPNLSVYLNGLRQVMFEDFNFIAGFPNKFEFATAPLLGDVVTVQYIRQV